MRSMLCHTIKLHKFTQSKAIQKLPILDTKFTDNNRLLFNKSYVKVIFQAIVAVASRRSLFSTFSLFFFFFSVLNKTDDFFIPFFMFIFFFFGSSSFLLLSLRTDSYCRKTGGFQFQCVAFSSGAC